MSRHVIPVRTHLLVFGALLVLLLATVGAAFVDLGRFNLVVALVIAGGKALLIILVFMHVRFSNRLTWVFSGAGFVWLSILIVLSLSDFLTRGWLDVPGK